MIVIVEGIDRVGKTTFAKMLEQAGFLYLKDAWLLADEIKKAKEQSFSVGKLDTMTGVLKQLKDKGINVVVDRHHLTEWVYGQLSRGYEPDPVQMNTIDRAMEGLKATLVYVMPESIQKSSKEAKVDLKAHDEAFYKLAAGSAITRKIFTRYSMLDESVDEIMNDMYQYDLYLASPFFNEQQVEREEFVKRTLRDQGLRVFSPKENCFLEPKASNTAQQAVFNENCNAIRACKAVIAITDGKDIGTIWEAGFAYGIGTPVVYYAETLGDHGFNLMLAQSGKKVILNRLDLDAKEIMNAITRKKDKFEGLIE